VIDVISLSRAQWPLVADLAGVFASRKLIVKLIVNKAKLISNNLLLIYNSESTTSESGENYGSTKDNFVQCQQRRFESEGLPTRTMPCDSESGTLVSDEHLYLLSGKYSFVNCFWFTY